jgi:ABC-type multidrug transport system ATPase subunit
MSGWPATRVGDRPVDGTRSALIIASDQYTDPGLRRLWAPASDARALAAVLRDPGIGGFEVRTLLNEPAHVVNLAVEEFFADRRADDLLLVHFSGHGIKDQDGELYFAASSTMLRRLGATAVAADFVNRQMNRSRSRRVVLLLDCCYAGAFERGLMPRASTDAGIEQQFDGRGRAVITASSAMEYAFEAAEPAEAAPSVFTSALVQGLRTGEADRDQDGLVGLDELYDYVFDKVRAATPNQTPGKWTFGVEGELYIARRSRPVTTPAPLPPELEQAMESGLAGIRAGAVQELAGILRGRHEGMTLAARRALGRLADDDSRAVAAAATAALGDQIPVPHPARGPTGADVLPGADRRPTVRMPLPAEAIRIGRAADNDLILADDLDTSPHHAELSKLPEGDYEIADLGSQNGTFVNGGRVSRAMVTEQDIGGIGRSTFRLAGDELRQFVDDGEISFTVQDLVVKVAGGKVLLDHVSFPVPESCLLCVIGPSGAGKSVLLGALTGLRPADTGIVLYDNRDLYRQYAELRRRIGLVPQQSALHTGLTTRRALQYSAELRFPADVGPSERDSRVDEVLGEVGLARHANTRLAGLSGGQLKRADIAQELLTKPSLLCLDEPTSGLDPGLDGRVMVWLRDLAHEGRTVIVVTHSVTHIDQCDRLLVLVPGGRMAYYGPPAEGLSYFGRSGWAEVFQAFERYPDRDWAAEFAASPACARYVRGLQGKPAQPPEEQRQPLAVPPPPWRGAIRQMTTLTQRSVRVIASERGYLAFMATLPFVLGLLILLFPARDGLAGPPGTNQNARPLLVMLVACACLAGAASSVRELVKEREIYSRERTAGLSSGAYLVSKLLVLGVISIVQSLILVTLGLAGRPMPSTGAFLTGAPLAELILGVAALAVASMCAGLLGSSLVSFPERTMPLLVLLTIIQVILSGGVISLTRLTGLSQLASVVPARWGFGAIASTANLNVITPPQDNFTDPIWAHTSANWLRDMGLTIGLAVIFALLTWLRLRRLSPGRRR